RLLRDAGIGFMFAPRFHPAMRHAGPVRREIGIRTVFNVLGPLTNPAGARHQVLGVATPTLAEKLALALGRMDIDHALVVHGAGGLDELSLSGPSLVYDVRPGQPPQRMVVDAAQLGLQPAPNEALRGGNAATNAAITKGVLTGAEQGPRRDVVLLNAAAALVAADAAPDLHTGIEQARASIDGGYAYERLQRMVNLSNFSE
ncbi:MAG: anthranilate phosphoribosyltransferase, partial [Chloroflexaceae bacterium]|nr:anthranilate phosphoribosyltransferase [Chloroflexaceae bacterium]